MPKITQATAFANGLVALICWHIDAPIPRCIGFTITRVYEDGTGPQAPDGSIISEKILPAWVPFRGQSNPDWLPQDTNVWPAQRLMWRDLTLRQKRDAVVLHPSGQKVSYKITPVGFAKPGEAILQGQSTNAFTGPKMPLAAVGGTFQTAPVTVTSSHGDMDCAFTNGVLSTQFLIHLFEKNNEKLNAATLKAHIKKVGDPVRKYLSGDVLPLITEFFAPAGTKYLQALYELEDGELIDLITGLKGRDRLILSNTAQDPTTKKWDLENQPVRDALHAVGFDLTDRLFNNSSNIGHNKFSIRMENGKPSVVLTGSTNWTSTGLCGQSNNALVIRSPELSKQYAAYWNDLKKDTAFFNDNPPNKKGTVLRANNQKKADEVTLGDGTKIQVWFSPNTDKLKPSGANPIPTPPDLSDVFSRMRRASQAILFAVFQPSQSARGDVVRRAIELGQGDRNLLVYGSISDKSAMPNFKPAPPKTEPDERTEDEKDPLVFDLDNVHIVEAAALSHHSGDLVGNFEEEMLKSSNMAHAIIHDKIVVVDPLSPDGFVVTGSHNVGVKASYNNDENLLIIRNNPSLILAYAVHVLDIYDHYRFRAIQAKRARDGHIGDDWFDGFLATDERWMDNWTQPARRSLSAYFAAGLRA